MRLYTANLKITWAKLRNALVGEYASEYTAIEIVRKLIRIRQVEGIQRTRRENVRTIVLAYAEELVRNSRVIWDVFVDTLREVRGDVIHGSPVKLNEAISLIKASRRLWERIRERKS